jgi:two-component system, OmpR family, sensor histidine kinase RstB
VSRLLLRLALAILGAMVIGRLATSWGQDRSQREEVQRVLAGPGELVARLLSELPPPERPAEAERLSSTFGYPVRLETEVAPRSVLAEWRGSKLALIAPLHDGGGQAVLGPVPVAQSSLGFSVWLLSSLLFVPGLALIATWPLLKRVRSLEDLATRMCEGNFAARSEMEPGEPLSKLGASLNHLADRIGQLLTDERDLMRTVAHEVRAPISRMRFRIEMLQDAASDQHARHAAGLDADLKQVDSLFEELLTYVAFDEFDHERPELTTTTFTLGEAVRPVVAEIADTAPQVTILVEGDDHATVVANRKLFDRAVANLVRNAVNYGNSRVTVIMRGFPQASVVDVQDDGPGIPEAERPQVIKPFVRFERGNRQVRGTGLGLAIVTRIMRLHHSSLHVVDAPRGGASCQLVWNQPAVRRRTWREVWARRAARRG